MNGENVEVILNSGLSRPVALTIDYVLNRLYVVDNFQGTLEFCDFNGQNRFVSMSNLCTSKSK